MIVSYLLDQLLLLKIISIETGSFLRTQNLSFFELFELISDFDVFRNTNVSLLKSNFAEEFILNLIFDNESKSSSITYLALNHELESNDYFCLISIMKSKSIAIGQLMLTKYEIEKFRDKLFEVGNFAKINLENFQDKPFLLRGYAENERELPLDELICKMPGLLKISIEALNSNIRSAALEIRKVQFISEEVSPIQGDRVEVATNSQINASGAITNISPSNSHKSKFNIAIFEFLALFVFFLTALRILGMSETLFIHLSNLLLN